jgi:hypothetical protein
MALYPEGRQLAHARYSSEEIARLGKQIYADRIRALVDTRENTGRIVSIDIETGDYHVGRDVLLAAEPLQQVRPGAALWSERIGYDAVFALGGGSITRQAK